MGLPCSWHCQGNAMGGRSQGKLPGSHLLMCYMECQSRKVKDLPWNRKEKEESLLLLNAYYCENTIINFFRSLTVWVIPCIGNGKMNCFSGSRNIQRDSIGALGKKCAHLVPPCTHAGNQASRGHLIHCLLEMCVKISEGWAFLKHPVIQVTCFKKETLAHLFFKEETAKRLMLLNHLVEKKFKSEGLLSRIIIFGPMSRFCSHLPM